MQFALSDDRRQAGSSGACIQAARGARRFAAVFVLAAVVLCFGPPANAADEAPAPAADAAFQPEDISIGEPISLPFAPPLPPPAPVRPADALPAAPSNGAFQAPAAQLPSVIAPAAGAPVASPPSVPGVDAAVQPFPTGNGWLGLAVDDTVVTGRLVVVEVAPDGPADKAGIRPQDMLLAINGNQLRNGDELAAALAAIGAGQRVKMAIGRDNRVEDVEAMASTRPPQAVSRDWQQAGPQNVAPAASVAVSPLPAPSFVSPAPQVVPSAPQALPPSPRVLPPAPQMLPPAPKVLAPAPTAPESSAVGLLPAPRPAAPASAPAGRTALGVRTVPVDPNVQSRFRLSDPQGAFVIGVVQDLPAAKAGVPPGSVIVAINHQPVRSPQDLTQLVTRGPVGTPVPIQFVLPGGQAKQAEVVLQSLEQPLERALVGETTPDRATQPPSLEPAPQIARRVQPTGASQAAGVEPLSRVEEMLRRMNNRLEQIERRLEGFDMGRH